MTAQLSREQLDFIVRSPECYSELESTMARMLLAGMDSEPVGEVVLGDYDDCGDYPDAKVVCIAAEGQADWNNFRSGTKLYAAPPAPVAVPDIGEFRIFTQAGGVKVAVKDGKTKNHLFGMGWNACRAAILKAGPVTAATVPDGWKLVPVEPTAEMISLGIAAHYEASQSKIYDRPVPGPMESGYMAMLAAAPAAPEQEV